MANKERGEYPVIVEGKPYTLRPTINAMCKAEALTGMKTSELVLADKTGSLAATRALIWAYLQPCHGKEIVTLDQAGEWIDRAGGMDAVNAALEQLEKVNEDDTPKGERGPANPQDAQVGNGAASTSRDAVLA